MTQAKEKVAEDQSELVNAEIPKWTDVALKEQRLQEAVDGLFVLEKKCRSGEDHISGQKVAVCLVQICFESRAFDKLKANLQILAKRRGQMKQVLQAAVQKSMDYLAQLTPAEEDVKIDLIDTLRSITAGKIYVENERARLTKQLADIREAQGNVKEASKLLQDVQVETYGAMEKREKSEFILEQIRLCLDSQDNIRALILSDKISPKLLKDDAFQDIKLRFHQLMIRYYTRKENFLAIARAYHQIYETPIIQADKERKDLYLKLVVLFVILSPYDSEQADMASRVFAFKHLADLPSFKNMLKNFIVVELVSLQRFREAHEEELLRMDIFQDQASEPLSSSSDDLMASMGDCRTTSSLIWSTLAKRMVEHNVRVIAAYYSRIHVDRLCSLLGLSEEEAEEHVSALVAKKSVYAKIDRANRIVVFEKKQQPTEQLNEWSDNIASLLQSLERVSHLIHRENMVHKLS